MVGIIDETQSFGDRVRNRVSSVGAGGNDPSDSTGGAKQNEKKQMFKDTKFTFKALRAMAVAYLRDSELNRRLQASKDRKFASLQSRMDKVKRQFQFKMLHYLEAIEDKLRGGGIMGLLGGLLKGIGGFLLNGFKKFLISPLLSLLGEVLGPVVRGAAKVGKWGLKKLKSAGKWGWDKLKSGTRSVAERMRGTRVGRAVGGGTRGAMLIGENVSIWFRSMFVYLKSILPIAARMVGGMFLSVISKIFGGPLGWALLVGQIAKLIWDYLLPTRWKAQIKITVAKIYLKAIDGMSNFFSFIAELPHTINEWMTEKWQAVKSWWSSWSLVDVMKSGVDAVKRTSSNVVTKGREALGDSVDSIVEFFKSLYTSLIEPFYGEDGKFHFIEGMQKLFKRSTDGFDRMVKSTSEVFDATTGKLKDGAAYLGNGLFHIGNEIVKGSDKMRAEAERLSKTTADAEAARMKAQEEAAKKAETATQQETASREESTKIIKEANSEMNKSKKLNPLEAIIEGQKFLSENGVSNPEDAGYIPTLSTPPANSSTTSGAATSATAANNVIRQTGGSGNMLDGPWLGDTANSWANSLTS